MLLVLPKSIEKTVEQMRARAEIRFADLAAVCAYYFGEPRIVGSHHIFSMPWVGDPRVNIQNTKGKAKAYQVRQVLAAIDRLAAEALVKAKDKKSDDDKSDKPKKK